MKKRLTKAEEEVMLVLWRINEGTVRDVMNALKLPDTPYTTVSTVIRVLEKKEFVGHKAVGTTYLYYPIVSKKEYLRGFLSGIAHNYFNGSFSNLATFFARETDMKMSDLHTMIQEIDKEINQTPPSDE